MGRASARRVAAEHPARADGQAVEARIRDEERKREGLTVLLSNARRIFHVAEVEAKEIDPQPRQPDRVPDPRWQSLFGDQRTLAQHVSQWSLGETVPAGIAEVLRLSRTLLVDSYYEYGYSLIAVSWGIVVLEACLRGCLPLPSDDAEDLRGFGALVNQARKSHLITRKEAAVLFEVVDIRNNTFHHAHLLPKPVPDSYSPEIALTMLEAIHDAVSDLYTRAASQVDAQRDA